DFRLAFANTRHHGEIRTLLGWTGLGHSYAFFLIEAASLLQGHASFLAQKSRFREDEGRNVNGSILIDPWRLRAASCWPKDCDATDERTEYCYARVARKANLRDN